MADCRRVEEKDAKTRKTETRSGRRESDDGTVRLFGIAETLPEARFAREKHLKREQKDKFKKILFPAITAAAVTVSALIAVFAPAASWLLLILMPTASVFLAATVAINKDPLTALIFIGLFFALTLLFKRFASTLLLYLMFAPIGVVTGIAFRKKKTVNASVLVSAIVTLIFGIGVFCTFAYEGHLTFDTAHVTEPIRQAISEAAEETANVIFERGQDTVSIYEKINGITLTNEEFRNIKIEFASDIKDTIILNLPLAVGSLFLLTAALSYFLTKSLLKRSTYPVGFATGFSEVRVSKTGTGLYVLASLVIFFSGVASVSEMISDRPWAFAVYIFETLLSYTLAFAGLSVFVFLLKNKGFPRKYKTVLIVATAVGFVLFRVSVFTLIGMLDSFRDLRRIGGEGV